MHNLGDLGRGADRPCTDARHQQKLGIILRTTFGGGGEIAVQSSGDNVLGPDIVMGGHDEMGQHGLGLRARVFEEAALQFRKLPLDSFWSDIAEKIELSPP
jgi:hypothetical protein